MPLAGRVCAVFDVLRATTTITAALAAGVKEIHLFDSLAAARLARRDGLLCGEEACLKPEAFDLGNSPGQFTSQHRDQRLFMCTTNGTRALLAARSADAVFTAALVNASAAARAMQKTGKDIVLLCAGTNGEVAMEDVLGAGAVIAALDRPMLESDTARMALKLFESCRNDLRTVLAQTRGGQNVIAAKLDEDIDFAARLDAFEVVGLASGEPLVVRRLT